MEYKEERLKLPPPLNLEFVTTNEKIKNSDTIAKAVIFNILHLLRGILLLKSKKQVTKEKRNNINNPREAIIIAEIKDVKNKDKNNKKSLIKVLKVMRGNVK